MNTPKKESWTYLSPEYRAAFLAACQLAATDDQAFANFRKEPHISTVIENTTHVWSDMAMAAMGWSPTTIRYFYLTNLMKKLIGIPNGVIIHEIGAGYGGHCIVLKHLYPIGLYYIYDLPEVAALQKRYLSTRRNGLNFVEWPRIGDETIFGNSICLSWCAWSELDSETKHQYFEEVISECDHFFICSNGDVKEDKAILSKSFDVKVYNDHLVQNVLYA